MPGKRYGIYFINLVLIIVIGGAAWFYFGKKTVSFSGDYGAQPAEIIELIGKETIGKHSASAVFMFNDLPAPGAVSSMEKLYTLYGERMGFHVFFTKPFKAPRPFAFPHQFNRRLRFDCQTAPGKAGDWFLLLDKRNVVFCSSVEGISFFNLNFLIRKNLFPGTRYEQALMDEGTLRSLAVERFKKPEVLFYSMADMAFHPIMEARYSVIYLIHANCSICQLKTLLRQISLKGMMNGEKPAILFSFAASRFDVETLMAEESPGIPIYLDEKDVLELSGRILNVKEEMIAITARELEEA